jgi:poly(hydroxyalkanoate) depolymerase family esterase
MSGDFMDAMGRALAAAKARQPGEATRIIQAALAGGAAPTPAPPRAGRLRLDPDAELARPGRERLRRPLREVLRTLREGRQALAPKGAPAPAPHVPEGAAFVTRSFACAAGVRDYRLYVPSPGPGPLRGLVVMLHGCRQNPDDFATGTGMNALAEEHRLIVAYPGQTSAHNLHGCWNWFRPGDQRRGAGEPAIIAGMARELAAEFGVDTDRVFAAGLSAGGAMAAVLAESYPDVFAAVGVHSGLPAGSANDVVSALAAMRGEAPLPSRGAAAEGPRLIVFHGAADATVRPVNAERMLEAGGREERGSAGGRRFVRRVLRGGRAELWMIEGAGHAWSGGRAPGSYTDPAGPDASAEMVRFFLA